MIDCNGIWKDINYIIPIDQSGFRKNRNTMEQCIRLENDIQKPFVNTYITVGVFIDFQKAFDMLWKHGLLQKMVSLNIYGNMLSYVKAIEHYK
jgi:hypothetical protein